ncbi:probable 54S ribosomal protein L9, mitochondrial [Saccharomycodes ludwigii]|uniref:Large ribosomal subunit protein uL3m n=1 Tax=Saccharomycodes ludwigii TaxID=36035 RepID=A0A376B132_9ASCO|nr:hypothetical protein SCDLUD_004502 [Saccharomycodes ludwigii]KAH3899079.1 hypothetical protein SCDLUD_004502 [Saccharomycodes ludwigii]SSD58341.1 probable 54S ribosomal protein L9, mitochondrial [Saccharomycodes ludwigii]
MWELLSKRVFSTSVNTANKVTSAVTTTVVPRGSLVASSIAFAQTIAPKKPLLHSNVEANKRKRLPNRCGAIACKQGMIPYFDSKTGKRLAATVLEMNNVEVVMNRYLETNGYYACQVGYGNKSPKQLPRQLLGHFSSKFVNPKLKVVEFRVKDQDGLLKPTTLIKPSWFKNGQYVDIQSVSKGKGFAGVMKRYGFKGQNASHGNSLAHRHGGSYGQNQTPGRVLPGKKMPGHMGVDTVTIQNVQVLKTDDELGIVLVKGSVAGPRGTFVKLQDAIKVDPFKDVVA